MLPPIRNALATITFNILWGPKPPVRGCAARWREKYGKHGHNSSHLALFFGPTALFSATARSPPAAAHELFLAARFSASAVWLHLKWQPGLIVNPTLLPLIGLASLECSTGIPCQLACWFPGPCSAPHQPWWRLLPGTSPRHQLLRPCSNRPAPSGGAPPYYIPLWGTTI